MIAFLEGAVVEHGEKDIVIQSGPVGWRVFVSRETVKHLPPVGKPVKLWTSFYLRQDGIAELYGFLSKDDKIFFELLNSVAGVGPKSALGVMGLASTEKLRSAVASGDAGLLTKVSGIGRKTAERIVVELRSKIHAPAYAWEALSADADAIEALAKLGYSKDEARRALAKVPQEIASLADRLKEALKNIGRS